MKCPKCGSEIVRKVHVLRPDWAVGLHECFACDYKGDWTDFGGHPFVVTGPTESGLRPRVNFDHVVTKTAVGDDD